MVLVALRLSSVDQILMGVIALPFVIDAIFGLFVLRKVFKYSQVGNREAMNEADASATKAKAANNRTPEMLRSKEMFQKSWKFDLFNQDQITKQILGISLIFIEIYFSALGLI